MTRVLITGGNGNLGRALTAPLFDAGYSVRVSSRSARSAQALGGVEWAQVTLETGEGLAEAVSGVDVIIHCATGGYAKAKQVDVQGTRQLLTFAKQQGVKHFVYLSIIGVDKIPNSYLQAKYDVEQVIKASGVPYTILRAAQFYGEFIQMLLKMATKPPIGLIPKDFYYQPVAIEDVAEHVVALVKAGPGDKVVDLVGPRTYDLTYLARTWLQAQGKRKPLLQLPIPGKFGAAMRAGYATAPEKASDGVTWEDWLQKQFGAGV